MGLGEGEGPGEGTVVKRHVDFIATGCFRPPGVELRTG